MSDVMLLGVLRMPIQDDPDPMTLAQFVDRARQAADRIEADASEIEKLRALLDHIGSVAHCGGLSGLSESDALVMVRRLTLDHWKSGGDNHTHKRRVDAAIKLFAEQCKADDRPIAWFHV